MAKGNKVIRDINFQLYLSSYQRQSFMRIYDVLLKNFNETYNFIYRDMIEDYNKYFDVIINEVENDILNLSYSDDYSDRSDYEVVLEEAVKRYEEKSLMYYQFVLMSLSNLYQVFEQQFRKWLFEEMTCRHNEYRNQIRIALDEKQYGTFYNNFGALTNVVKELQLKMSDGNFTSNLDFFELADASLNDGLLLIESDEWKIIRECNLLSNTFKHGNGNSAMALYKIRPDYFEEIDDTKLMNLYRTTNLEKVLCVEKLSYESYIEAFKNLWKKINEHQSGTLKLEVKVT